MFKLMGKKKITILGLNNVMIWIYYVYVTGVLQDWPDTMSTQCLCTGTERSL